VAVGQYNGYIQKPYCRGIFFSLDKVPLMGDPFL
jgi:hypothetical protein